MIPTTKQSTLSLFQKSQILQIGQGSDIDDDNDARPVFEVFFQNLPKIGAMTIEQLLRSPSDIDDFDTPYHVQEIRDTSPTPPSPLSPTELKQPIKLDGPPKMECVAQLHHACQRAFRKTDMLKFEYIEEDGPNSECWLLYIILANRLKVS